MASELNKIPREQNQNINLNEKEIYFIISNTSEEKIDFKELKCQSEKCPKIIYETNIEKGKDSIAFVQVFKLSLNQKESPIKYKIQYEKGEILYDILFDIKNNIFIYETTLQKYNKYIDNITKENIDQNQISIQNKLNIFLESLEKNNEMNKIEILYKEAIELYKSKKTFGLLIFLFLKLYQQKKELCSYLIDIFKEINNNENNDRDKNLAIELETFNQIYSNANNIIEENKYDPIGFYGIIFCYLCSYDKENFSNIINNFSEKNVKILYEILIIYHSHFNISLNKTLEFYNNFVFYIINQGKNYKSVEIILNYIDDIEIFLYVINDNKNEILKKYDKELRIAPIIPSPKLKLIKKEYEEEKKIKTELDNIIDIIEKLIEFSKDNSFLLIYLNDSFWIYLLKQYNKPDIKNIYNCYQLRKLFKKYKDLINALYKNSSDKNELKIKEEIDKYNDKDEFAFILNKNIKELFEISNDKFKDIEKLGIIEKYNPYYNCEIEEDEMKYKNSRETYIFDYINFQNHTYEFKESFHRLNFEQIFKENIKDFISKITSKIKDISSFSTVIDIIDITRLEEDAKIYYCRILKEKFEYIIKYELESLKDEDKLNESIRILSNSICLISEYEKNTIFLEEQITRLNNELQKLIYFEIIREHVDEKYEKIKNFIFELYLKKIKEPDEIIEFIKILNDKDKNIFLEKLIKICEFDKNEFFSNCENDKIKLLCKLNEQEIINENNCGKLDVVLDEIKNDLEEYSITKRQLEEFLNKNKNSENGNEKDKNEVNYNYNNPIIQKLALIKIISPKYDPQEKYGYYIKFIKDINKKTQELKYIKNSLILFHKNIYNEEIKSITNIINNIETKKIKEFYVDEIWEKKIRELFKLTTMCDEINKVKDFLLFKKIFEKSKGRDREERFKEALIILKFIKKYFEKTNDIETIFKFKLKRENENIFENIKDDLSKKKDSQSELFVVQMIEYFNIRDENNRKDLIILIKSKKYELIVKSIKFFIEDCLNKKLSLPKDLELSKMDLRNLKIILSELKHQNIYENESWSSFYKIFTSFYNKKEAIDFLLSKIESNFDDMKYKLVPTNRSISMKDIEDAKVCLNLLKEIKNRNGQEIIEYCKYLDEETINKIVNYSKNYSSIISLETKNEEDIFENIYIIIDNARLTFQLDFDMFLYIKDGENIKINIDEIICLKNKINFLINNNKEIKVEEKDIYQIKCEKLIFFKKIMSDIEIIYDIIKILRKEGYNVPILINIQIKYPNIIYEFNGEEYIDLNIIKNHLCTVLIFYENQIDTIYKSKKYLRFLYGKLFRKIQLHQEGYYDARNIIRYILNRKEYYDKIIDGDPFVTEFGFANENLYKEYIKNIFDNINYYLISLFFKNGLDFEKHYNNMLIKEDKKCKGIFIIKCENISIEEYILKIFQEKLDKLPIAQNILNCNNKTSIEEIKSFLYRAILSDYNTLFIIEILDSFSSFQFKKMYIYIVKLLSYKLEKFKKENKEYKCLNKLKTGEYLDSCIYFIYKNLENESSSFLNELEKYSDKKICGVDDLNISSSIKILDNSYNNLDNIKVFSSEICGLGKSFKIKKLIKENHEIYYYFPLGGKLTKNIIYEKLSSLLEKIKIELKTKNNNGIGINLEKELIYNNIAIHLDLYETQDISLINEFLFSFLITKFYINDGDVIYIPNNIKIYVEIPNSYNNFISKLGILNIFNIDNITLNNLPKLELNEDIKIKFNNLLGKEAETVEQIENFVKENIGLKEYSYYQIQIFINLFISQFGISNKKIRFYDSQKNDITNKCIKLFAESAKHCIYNGFANLIIKRRNNIRNKTDLCLDIYKNDLSIEKLLYIDKTTLQFKVENFQNISKEVIDIIKNIKNKKNEVNIAKGENPIINPSYIFLKKLENILIFHNDADKTQENMISLTSILNSGLDNYVITEDNYKKMILLFYRISANIPVIIMGETGFGKTYLIKKVSQILNKGQELLEFINIYPGITEEEIITKMKEINLKAKNLQKELLIFFDNINACSSLAVITEIFVKRTFNGEKTEENIRLIGACNPYRIRVFSTEDFGITREENEYDTSVYKVEQLPQSLLYFVFNFGVLNDEDEKEYIKSIIYKLFNKEEEKLCQLTVEAISKCHIFLREIFKEPSIVSLRDISRFIKCVDFFEDYFLKKKNQNIDSIDDETKKLYKIKSIICSIYTCYYLRLSNEEIRDKFEFELQTIFLKIVNIYSSNNNEEDHRCNLFDKIKNKKLKEEVRDKNIEHFSGLLKIEEEFLLNQIELDIGISKNKLLKENLFLLFLSIVTKIPLIIVGKPGTGKSLSVQLIYNSMRGEYSKNDFFKKYPSIIQLYFQGSEYTNSEDISSLFIKAENYYYKYMKKCKDKNKVPIYMIVFDNLELCQKASSNPLQLLNKYLDNLDKNENVCFIGISNYILDISNINRVLNLSVPNLEDDLAQIKFTSKSIVSSISEEISKDPSNIFIFNILSRAYYLYKYYLKLIKNLMVLKDYFQDEKKSFRKIFHLIQFEKKYKDLLKKEKKIKIEFHGNRDFYNLIKSIAIEGSKLYNISDENRIVPIIENYIERNFGGIYYEINKKVFEFKFEDIKEEEINRLKEILKEKVNDEDDDDDDEDKIIKISSIYLFKKIYNEACNYENDTNLNLKGDIYKIKDNNINRYNLIKCINDNINDNNSRYLLLRINPNLSTLIINFINKIQNKNVTLINGSPFSDDFNNKEYKNRKINEIQEHINKSNELIILQNLDGIYPYLYDLYNKNYNIIDEQKYAKIYLNNFNEELIPVSDSFTLIIISDKSCFHSYEYNFLSRFEKIEINFKELLDFEQRNLTKEILSEIRLKEEIKEKQSKINYYLNHLLINCTNEDIYGLVYYFTLEYRNKGISIDDLKDKIFNKISNIIAQDIIVNLPETNIIKMKYYAQKRYNNFKEYIKDLEYNIEINNNKYKISIIYTFSNIANIIDGYNNKEFNISEIKTENELKKYLDDIKYNNIDECKINRIILIHFEENHSNKIQYFSDYINNYCKDDNYNYIFIIHIQRKFYYNSEQNIKRIYSIPNIYDNINQLFIDNLNGPSGISLKDLINKNIKEILQLPYIDIETVFEELLIDFINNELNETLLDINKNNQNNKKYYCNKIFEYMNKEKQIKKDLIELAIELINHDEEFEVSCQHLIDKMLKNYFINKSTIDIITSLLEFIKNDIFNKILKRIFNLLDKNNFFKILLKINEDKETKFDEKVFKNIKDKLLFELKINISEEGIEMSNNLLNEQKKRKDSIIEMNDTDLKE